MNIKHTCVIYNISGGIRTIIAVGYRVNSAEAMQFRIWATNTLKEFITKGFVLDDERIIYIPISWSRKLQKAKPGQRQNFKNTGIHVFWDDLNEIIGVKNILFGKELFI